MIQTVDQPEIYTGKDKISWVHFYLKLAFEVSKKSPDIHTKHGCYITDKNHIPLGFGFNGFPRNIDDIGLPLNRPKTSSQEDYYKSKYPWMAHSERNALAHCQHRPEDGIAYVTGHSCNDCIYALWQHGVKTVYMANRHGTALINEYSKGWFDEFINRTKMQIFYVDIDPNWVK